MTAATEENTAIIATRAAQAYALSVGKFLGQGDLDGIVAKISGAMSPEQVSLLATDLAEQRIKDSKPLNALSATPQELEAARLAKGLLPFDTQRGKFALKPDGTGARADNGAVQPTSGSRSADYQTLNFNSPDSLRLMTSAQFASSVFATKDHLSFDTFSMLRGYQFNGSEIRGGVHDAHEIFGKKFDVNHGDGPAVVRDAAGLRHEAPKQAAHIIHTMKQKKELCDHDRDVQGAGDDIAGAPDGSKEEEKGFERMSKGMQRADDASGVGAALKDPALSPKARAYGMDLSARVENNAARAAILLGAKRRGLSPDAAQRKAERWEMYRLQHGGPPTMPVPAAGAKPGHRADAAPPASPAQAALDRSGKALSADQRLADAKAAEERRKTTVKRANNDAQLALLDAPAATPAVPPAAAPPPAKDKGGPVRSTLNVPKGKPSQPNVG